MSTLDAIQRSSDRLQRRIANRLVIAQRKKKKTTKATPTPQAATLSPTTRDRLLAAALSTFGMHDDPAIIKAWIDEKIHAYLSHMPVWFGHTPGADAHHRNSQRRYLIDRGLIEKQEEPAGLAARRRQQSALIYEDEADELCSSTTP